MFELKKQYSNMNRLVLIVILSIVMTGINTVQAQYSVISNSSLHLDDRTYGNAYGAGVQDQHNNTNRDYEYQSSYSAGSNYDRVSANTFSNTPSMEITTMLPPEEEYTGSFSGRRMSSGIRPPQRDVETGDEGEKEPDTNDPNATPLGDTPWLLMLLLAVGYGACVWRKKDAAERV